jgi:hypothetical protein
MIFLSGKVLDYFFIFNNLEALIRLITSFLRKIIKIKGNI